MKSTKILLVFTINSYLLMNSWVAGEQMQCKDLIFVQKTANDQENMQQEISSQYTLGTSLWNAIRLTNSGSPLQNGVKSDLICRCLKWKLNPNRQLEEYVYIYASKEKINIQLGDEVKTVNAIHCVPTEYFVIKSHVAGSLCSDSYDFYLLHKGENQYEYICDGVLENTPMSAFKPLKEEVGCFNAITYCIFQYAIEEQSNPTNPEVIES